MAAASPFGDAFQTWPRHERAREIEAKPVRSPRAIVFLRGGHAAPDGDTIHDVTSIQGRLGYDSEVQGDNVLVHAACTVRFPQEGVARTPKVGDSIQVRLGTDPVERVTMFNGFVENVQGTGGGKGWALECFDPLRRLRELPFGEPVAGSGVEGEYFNDWTETTLEASVQVQVADLLGQASVMTHSYSGIEQYPIVEQGQPTLFLELADLLRSASLRAYLTPTGRLLVQYTDGTPMWATTMMSDLAQPSAHIVLLAMLPHNTKHHLPLLQVSATYPNHWRSRRTDSLSPTQYPDWFEDFANVFYTSEPFCYTAHNVITATELAHTLVVNAVRVRTTPNTLLRDFLAMSALSFADLNTVSFSQLGEGSNSDDVGKESVTEHGLRMRDYSLGGLSEVPRASLEPTSSDTGSKPSVNYGRYALGRDAYAEAQRMERQWPRQRILLRCPGVLSVMPFEVCQVHLPDDGFMGWYMLEGRRFRLNSGGFTTDDVLVRLDTPPEWTALTPEA